MPLPDLQAPLALLEQNEFDTAVEVLEQKVTALPAHLGAHILLAHAYEAQQRWDRALEAWATAHFLLPNSPIAAAGKQRVLRRMDDAEENEQPPSAGTSPPLPGPATAPPAPSEDETEEPSSEDDFGLAQLRRQAEREARQGGARPGLTDAPPSVDPSETDSSTPEEQIEHLEGEDGDDLDDLIDKLQSARINPDPDAETDAPPPAPDDSEAPPPDEAPEEEIVSETLAKIHEGQGDYRKAAQIYATLADQEPERADEYREKAAEMQEQAEGAEEDT